MLRWLKWIYRRIVSENNIWNWKFNISLRTCRYSIPSQSNCIVTPPPSFLIQQDSSQYLSVFIPIRCIKTLGSLPNKCLISWSLHFPCSLFSSLTHLWIWVEWAGTKGGLPLSLSWRYSQKGKELSSLLSSLTNHCPIESFADCIILFYSGRCPFLPPLQYSFACRRPIFVYSRRFFFDSCMGIIPYNMHFSFLVVQHYCFFAIKKSWWPKVAHLNLGWTHWSVLE